MVVRLAAVLLVAALAPLAAGCGGGGGKNGSTAVADSSVGETATGATSTGGGSATKAKSCKELTSLANRVSAAFQGTDAKNIQKNARLLKQFADQTPDAIRPDFELIAADVQKIADSLKGVKNPNKATPAQRTRIQKAAQSIDQAKLRQAIQHITTWSQQNC